MDLTPQINEKLIDSNEKIKFIDNAVKKLIIQSMMYIIKERAIIIYLDFIF